jgi:hypothetical protein
MRVSAAPTADGLATRFRVLVICRQHGDEPVSTESALALLHEYAVEPVSSLRRQIGSSTLYIIPMANPDGADALRRENGVGADLNRDWGHFTQPETRAIFAAYKMIRPQAVIDMHSWTAGDPFQANSLEVASLVNGTDLSARKSAAIETEIIENAHQRNHTSLAAFDWSPWCDTTLADRYFAKIGAVSMLVETASGWSTTPAMQSRMRLDETALRCVFADISKDPAGWTRIAARQHSTIAPASAFVASAAALDPKLASAALRGKRHPWRIVPSEVKCLLWTLGAYLAACIVLARLCGRLVLRSLRRLSRDNFRAPRPQPRYVSIHRRHFPDSPVDIGYRGLSRHERFDLRYNSGPGAKSALGDGSDSRGTTRQAA